MFEIMVMIHAVFGLAVLMAGTWVFVEAQSASRSNVARIRRVSRLKQSCNRHNLRIFFFLTVLAQPQNYALSPNSEASNAP